jgi:hypothetical protein
MEELYFRTALKKYQIIDFYGVLVETLKRQRQIVQLASVLSILRVSVQVKVQEN